MAREETPRRCASKAYAHLAAAAIALIAHACAPWRAPPDLSDAWAPEKLAPAAADAPWRPPETSDAYAPSMEVVRPPDEIVPPADVPQDLPALIDVALRQSPDTREAWEAARAAAASYGQSLAPYYPVIGGEMTASPNQRFLFQDSPATLTLKQDSYQPAVSLTYTLLDFGRRAQSAELARQRLIASNFTFNRALQTIVFRVQKAYYLLDAAEGMKRAAVRNLELARTVLAAADERLNVGLGTRPDQLLAKQVEARAVYELENARVLVENSQADLALALGLPANRPLRIESLREQPVPAELGAEVDRLIDEAIDDRPDLSARVADLRAAEASVERARAEFFPTLDFMGTYGLADWDYSINGAIREQVSSPQYSTVFGLRWDAFRGFERMNAVREAEAETERARAALTAETLDAIAEVWRAYYDFRAALRKLEYARALLAASEDAYEANLRRYENGLGTIVDLLTAERDLASGRYILVQSRADTLIGAARIAYASGRTPQAASPGPP